MREITMLHLATLVSALGCGLIAGVFFGFSTFVMKALGNLPPPQGIAAMQSINVVVINPWFMTAFLGTGVVCLIVLIASLMRWQVPVAPYLLSGSLLYLVGTVLVTMLFNVPRNNALAAIAPNTSEAAALWASYLSSWTTWNHVRTIAALAASALFTIAFRLQA
jgi:uncharacterized membrane protein